MTSPPLRLPGACVGFQTIPQSQSSAESPFPSPPPEASRDRLRRPNILTVNLNHRASSHPRSQDCVSIGTAGDYIIIGAFDRIVSILDGILSLMGHALGPRWKSGFLMTTIRFSGVSALVELAVALAIVAVLISAPSTVSGGESALSGLAQHRIRRPVALSLSRDGARLFAANGRSGSLSVVDTRLGRVIAEHDVGQGLADLAAWGNGRHLLAVDRTAGELVLLAHEDPRCMSSNG